MTTMNLIPSAASPPRGRIIFIVLAGMLLLACLAYVAVHAMRESRRAATHTSHPVVPAATPPPAAPLHTSAVTHATPAPTSSAEHLAGQLAAEAAAFRATISALTSRLERMSGTDAAFLLRTTPELPARIELAARVSSTCRNYAAGAWFLSNVYLHALASGSVTDVFRAGWCWGNFAMSHEQFEHAVAHYVRTLEATGEPPGIPYGSYSLLLERLAFAQYLAGDHTACAQTAAKLYAFLSDDKIPLSSAARGNAAFTYLACLWNTRQYTLARNAAAEIQARHPAWLEDSSLASCIQTIRSTTASDEPFMILPPSLK